MRFTPLGTGNKANLKNTHFLLKRVNVILYVLCLNQVVNCNDVLAESIKIKIWLKFFYTIYKVMKFINVDV